jgi:hypothetical protein
MPNREAQGSRIVIERAADSAIGIRECSGHHNEPPVESVSRQVDELDCTDRRAVIQLSYAAWVMPRMWKVPRSVSTWIYLLDGLEDTAAL